MVMNTNSKFSNKHTVHILLGYNKEGELICDGNRNVIRVLEVDGERLNIKPFKIPNIINQRLTNASA